MRKVIHRNILWFTLTISIVIVLVVTYLYVQFSYFATSQSLKEGMIFVRVGVENEGLDYLESFGDKLTGRLTYYSKDGKILYDNIMSAEAIVNYNAENNLNSLASNNPEIEDALLYGGGISSSVPDYDDRLHYHYAELLDDGSILRFSAMVGSFSDYFISVAPYALGIMVIVFIVVYFMGQYLAKRIVKPLNALTAADIETGNVVYPELLPFHTKITEQKTQIKEQKERLDLQDKEFSNVINNMTEGLVLLDDKGKIIYINESAIDLLGCSDKDYSGRSYQEISRNQEFLKLTEDSLSGQAFDDIIEVSERYYQFYAHPVRNINRIDGAVVLILDVTEKYKLELMQKEFSANVTHEFKTPLTSISGYSELMMTGKINTEDVVDFAKRINHETNRLIRLSEEIILLSKMDESGMFLHKENFELYDSIKTVVSRLEDYALLEKSNIVVDLQSAIFYGDRYLFDEMVSNILDNAIKYNRKGGNIQVSLVRKRDFAYLSIKDEGIGMSRQEQTRMFERFYRVDKSRSKETGGTGLGLTIAKESADLLGIEIKVSSEPGEGTEFILKIPLAE